MLRSLTALLAGAALAAATTGCGTDDINPDALAQAADATKAQEGVHLTIEATAEAAGQKIPLKMEGDADLKNTRVRLTVDSTGKSPGIEQILIGTTMYMHIDGAEDKLGAKWAKVDLQRAGEAAGFDFGQMMQNGGNSPSQQLDQLRAVADLEDLGKEEVDGVETTHYKGVIDLRKYPDSVPAKDRETARRNVEGAIKLSGSPTSPVEVWIDKDHLIRRQKRELNQKKPVELHATYDMRFSDFGKHVDIEEPTGDVKDLTDVASKSLGDATGG